MMHNPFGNWLTSRCFDLQQVNIGYIRLGVTYASIGDHDVCCHTSTMITGRRILAFPDAVDSLHFAFKGIEDFLGAIDSHGFATGARAGKLGPRVTSSFRHTAFEICRTWTLAGFSLP